MLGGFNLPTTPTEAITRSIQNPITPAIGAIGGNLARYGIGAAAGAGALLLLGGGGQEQDQEASQGASQNLDLAQRMQQEILTKIANINRQGADTSGSVTIGGSAPGARILSPVTTSTATTTTLTETNTITYNIQAPTTYTLQTIAQEQEQKSDQSGLIMLAIAGIIGAVFLFKK